MPTYALQPSRSQLLAEAVGHCMRDKGWNVTVSSDAGVSNVDPLPDDELQTYQDDYNDCGAQVGTNATANPADLNVSAIDHAWEREKESWACLHAAGFTVAEVPSLTVYEQTARAGKPYSSWQMLISKGEASRSDLERLMRLCPDPMQWFGD